MICNIISSDKDLDYCVKAQTSVYIVLRLCVNAKEKLGYWVFGMSVGKHSTPYYAEEGGGRGGLCPPIPPFPMQCMLIGHTCCMRKFAGVGVLITGARGLATGGYAA